MTDDEEQKFSFNAERLFPEAARRVKILEELKESWGEYIHNPALARHSYPYNLGVNEISISVDDEQSKAMLIRMRGNISRILKRLDYTPRGELKLNITMGEPFKVKEVEIDASPARPAKVEITDEELNEAMKGAPEDLPEDINRAISHLKIFLEKRFPQNNV